MHIYTIGMHVSMSMCSAHNYITLTHRVAMMLKQDKHFPIYAYNV